MRMSLCIPAIVLYYAVRTVCSNCVQVGTVLFTTTDLVKKCWSESDKALLRARLIMQDVLPDPDCIDFSKPDMVITLLDYFQACYDIITLSTYGNVQNLMYLAMSDAFGGYLRGYVLPLTKLAFYAGQIKYREAKKLFRLYDDIRAFLNTNGAGWTKPQKTCKIKFVPKPLVIGDSKGIDPCSRLYTIVKKNPRKSCRFNFNDENEDADADTDADIDENPRNLKSELRQKHFEVFNPNNKLENSDLERGKKNLKGNEKVENMTKVEESITSTTSAKIGEKKNASEEIRTSESSGLNANSTVRYGRSVSSENEKLDNEKCKFEVCDYGCYKSGETQHNRIVIPLPVLDDCKTLHTIAVPFKVRPLRNVQTRKSAFILEHYYITVIKCLMSKCSSEKDVKHFNAQFHTWLVTQVFPHLDDEQWYPAFGGVYRIAETIRKLGVDFSIRESAANDIGYIFSKGFEFEDASCDKHSGKEKTREVGDDFEEDFEEEEDYRPRKYYLGALFILAMIWTCSCCACVTSYCAQACGKRKPAVLPAPSDSTQCTNDERLVNFHFLVKFFKKKPAEKINKNSMEPTESFCKNNNNKIVNYFTSEKEVKINENDGRRGSEDNVKTQKRDSQMAQMELRLGTFKKGTLDSGECNIPVLISTEDPSKNFQEFSGIDWPYKTALLEPEKTEITDKGSVVKTSSPLSGEISPKENKKTTLWNKLSKKITSRGKKIKNSSVELKMSKIGENGKITLESTDGRTRKITHEKILPYHGQRKGFRNMSLSSTNSFCQTQVDDDTSTGRNLFCTSLKRRRRIAEPSSLEETTGESDSEREASSSTETESTETALN